MPAVRATTAPDPRTGRPLRADERALLERLCAVVPSAADVLVGLDGVRVREDAGPVGGRATRSVVRVGAEHRPATAVLPVRGFAVDEGGRAVGEVEVWVADGRLVGYRWRAAPGCAVPGRVDPDMLDAVPWG